MRLSTNYQFDRMQSSVQRSGQAYFDAQYKVTTGKRMNRLSDDPAAIEPLVSMRSLKASMDQYNSNLKVASNTFAASENAFSEVATILNRANQLAISGGTATASSTQRQAMADEIKSLRERIISLGNTKAANGDYIFSGTNLDVKPFQDNGTIVTFQGDTMNRFIESGPGERINLTLANSKQAFMDSITRLDALQTALTMGDQATLNGPMLTDLKSSQDAFNQLRGEIGMKTQSLQATKTNFERRSLDLTQGISDLEEVDLSQAITDMKKAETAYQAALQVTSIGSKLSLMDFIRG
ncbi:MAG: flagellar hook-associated protein FlgL [Armatimonadota bacterium]|jgi:flagellar hook-associated protein 3 FlgL|nr:flagellar hook-associated protein FlgL [Fimbriimonadaceae bacterium]